MSEQNSSFNYTYSAEQQKEIEEIRKKYVPNKKPTKIDRLTQLRKIDNSVTSKATVAGLVTGILSALVMGFGMSLIMTDLGAALGTVLAFVLGSVIGLIGMAGVIIAYPLYCRVLKNERQKAAPEIIKLTEETD